MVDRSASSDGPGRLEITIVDSATGSPIAVPVHVELQNQTVRSPGRSLTGGSGSPIVIVEGLQPGTYALELSAAGYSGFGRPGR